MMKVEKEKSKTRFLTTKRHKFPRYSFLAGTLRGKKCRGGEESANLKNVVINSHGTRSGMYREKMEMDRVLRYFIRPRRRAATGRG